MPVMSRAQNREITAGSIMMPTASKVPSAWKPPTRFITTSARNAICAGPPARLTERRKPGSTHSSTSGRQISARTISETLVMPTISSSVGSSTASTEPNRKCSRSTLVPLTETMVTPSASEIRKNAASEASSLSCVERAIRPAPTRDDEARDQAAARHGEQAQARDHEADRGAGQDGMRHGVADQAHAPQHQEHADRRGAERQRKACRPARGA